MERSPVEASDSAEIVREEEMKFEEEEVEVETTTTEAPSSREDVAREGPDYSEESDSSDGDSIFGTIVSMEYHHDSPERSSDDEDDGDDEYSISMDLSEDEAAPWDVRNGRSDEGAYGLLSFPRECGACSRRFDTARRLAEHRRRRCPDNEALFVECRRCGEEFCARAAGPRTKRCERCLGGGALVASRRRREETQEERRERRSKMLADAEGEGERESLLRRVQLFFRA